MKKGAAAAAPFHSLSQHQPRVCTANARAFGQRPAAPRRPLLALVSPDKGECLANGGASVVYLSV